MRVCQEVSIHMRRSWRQITQKQHAQTSNASVITKLIALTLSACRESCYSHPIEMKNRFFFQHCKLFGTPSLSETSHARMMQRGTYSINHRLTADFDLEHGCPQDVPSIVCLDFQLIIYLQQQAQQIRGLKRQPLVFIHSHRPADVQKLKR